MLNFAIVLATLSIGMVLRDTPRSYSRPYYPHHYPPYSLGASAATLLFVLILVLCLWGDVLFR